MTKQEAIYLASFLSRFREMLGNESCNDMLLPDTEENRDFLLGVQLSQFADDPTYFEDAEDATTLRTCKWSKDQPASLITFNTVVVGHLIKRFMQEKGIVRADLIDRSNW